MPTQGLVNPIRKFVIPNRKFVIPTREDKRNAGTHALSAIPTPSPSAPSRGKSNNFERFFGD